MASLPIVYPTSLLSPQKYSRNSSKSAQFQTNKPQCSTQKAKSIEPTLLSQHNSLFKKFAANKEQFYTLLQSKVLSQS